MESATDNVEETLKHSRRQIPSLPHNVLQPEKDFILAFEALPELWDSGNPQYTNKYKRNENLAKLLPILQKINANATLEEVKKKINTIRSNYRRELKKILLSKRSGIGKGEIYTPKIWYFPYLHFLPRLEEPESLQQESEPTHQVLNEHKQFAAETGQQSFSSVSRVPKPSASSRTKKQKINHDELLQRACRYLSESCTQASQPINLPNPIALEWSNTLDRLDAVQRLYAKKAINDILFEAELGNLNRHSVQINVSPPPVPNQISPVPYSTTQKYNAYSHYSSPKNSALTSPPSPTS